MFATALTEADECYTGHLMANVLRPRACDDNATTVILLHEVGQPIGGSGSVPMHSPDSGKWDCQLPQGKLQARRCRPCAMLALALYQASYNDASQSCDTNVYGRSHVVYYSDP